MCTHLKTFSTSYTCQLWRNFKFLHICHVEKFEITPHVEKFQISRAYKSEISPHDKFFSTYLTCDTCDKYQVCSDPHVSHIFGKLSPCSFTWSYPGKIFLHKIFEEKQKKQKMHFFAIFRVAPP